MEVDPKFLEPEYPFEWSGLFQLDAGNYYLKLKTGPDPAMKISLCEAKDTSESSMHDLIEKVYYFFRQPS